VGPVPVVRRGAAFPGRRGGEVAGRGLGSTAALLVVPEFIRLTVRAASDHRWDDRGEKGKGDEKARNRVPAVLR